MTRNKRPSADPGPEPAEPLLDRKFISLLINSIFMPDFESCKVLSLSRSTEVNYASEGYFELIQTESDNPNGYCNGITSLLNLFAVHEGLHLG